MVPPLTMLYDLVCPAVLTWSQFLAILSISCLVDNHVMEKVDIERYLGDISSVNGKINKNISARKAKGTGIIDKITSILQEICFR